MAKTKKLQAGPEMDEFLGKKVMKFAGAKWFKNGGGCYPEDATPINDEPGKCWSATSKGGTYPFLAGDTLFRGVKGGFGETWHPSTSIAQAFEIVEKLGYLSPAIFMCGGAVFLGEAKRPVGGEWGCRFDCAKDSKENYIIGYGDTPEEAICKAAAMVVAQKEKS